MKFVFYGGHHEKKNRDLHIETIGLTAIRSPRIAFIPASSFGGDLDFQDFVAEFYPLGIRKFLYFPVDIPSDFVLRKEVFKADVIHLGGGNTYEFLRDLRKRDLLGDLKRFVERGGVLTGLSAGGIIMTPTIKTAGFPSFDKDDNDIGLKNLKSLNLVKFEFFPHYRNSKRYDSEILRYSKKTNHPIYACPDGSGIVVEPCALKFVGRCFVFEKGQKFTVKSVTSVMPSVRKNYSFVSLFD